MTDITSLRFDNTDKNILKGFFNKKKEFTSTDLTREIFQIKDTQDLRNKNSNVIRRMEKLSKYGLLLNEKESGENKFNINSERVIFGEGEIKIKTGKKKKTFPLGDILMLRANGKWVTYQE